MGGVECWQSQAACAPRLDVKVKAAGARQDFRGRKAHPL